MSHRTLRHKPRISYYEPEEPDLDEYVFCEKCGDYVYEYCSIHGPLLVIPDDKVPAKPNVPSYVPRAALTIPHVFLHITYSIIPDAGLGVFTSMALPSGVRFGPYLGQRTNVVDSSYCWQIYDKNRKPLHCIDAADGNKSNWMRYVNCARHWKEQNLVAYQYQGELYYRTIKIIPRFTELMVFYGSEFACELDVNLGKYNSPAGYAQKFGAPVAKKRKLNDEEEIQTANAEATAADAPKSAPSAIIKDITTETLNGQVMLTLGPEQVEVTLNKTTMKPTGSKTKKTKNNAATKNKAMKKNELSYDQKVIKINKAPKIAQTKQDTTFIDIPKPTIEIQEGKNNDINYLDKVAESKANINKQNNSSLDLYIYCESCNKRCLTKQELQRHLRFHDLSREYSCDVCHARFTHNSNFKRHMRTHTGDKPYSCDVCHARFTEKGSLKIHMRTHTRDKPHSCNVCHARFTRNGHLKIHMRTHTGDKPYSCDVCQARFTRNDNLKIHMRTHTRAKPYSCDVCHSRFTHNGSLKNHMRTHTGDKPYSCDVCHARFTRNDLIKIHMRTHTGEKPYSCDVCHARFTRNDLIKIHMRTHTGDKPYSCDVCHARFTQNSNFKRHMRTHTGNKPYSCDVCHARFTQNGHLKIHMRTHTGDKPYSCDVCHARFTQNGDLKTHMRTHTGDEPYFCDVCHARFTQNSNFKSHMRTHTGDKLYSCDVCHARFTINGNLKTHMRTHTGEKQYACEICDTKFANSNSLKNHLVKIHLGDSKKPTA